MSLTKKHFKAIAEIIKKHTEPVSFYSDEDEIMIDYIEPKILCKDLADYFGRENQLFDRDKFLKACGIKE